MPYFECIDCGEEFWREDDERWKVRCYACWRYKKDHDLAYQAWEQSELKRFQAEVKRLYEGQAQAQSILDGLRYHLSFLIFVAHPDRNNNDHRANEVTRWLLEIREILGKGQR